MGSYKSYGSNNVDAVKGTVNAIDIYVSGVSGVDTNDGSFANPVATVTEAMQRAVALMLDNVVTVHVGPNAGGASYAIDPLRMPDARTVNGALVIKGDGGVGGGTGLTVLSSFTTGGGSTPTVIAGTFVAQQHRGKTIVLGNERRTIVNQSTTEITVSAAFTVPVVTVAATIVEPAVTLALSAVDFVQGAGDAVAGGAAAAAPGLYIFNLRLEGAGASDFIGILGCTLYLYGVELVSGSAIIASRAALLCGQQSTFVFTNLNTVAILGAPSESAYLGYGLCHPAAAGAQDTLAGDTVLIAGTVVVPTINLSFAQLLLQACALFGTVVAGRSTLALDNGVARFSTLRCFLDNLNAAATVRCRRGTTLELTGVITQTGTGHALHAQTLSVIQMIAGSVNANATGFKLFADSGALITFVGSGAVTFGASANNATVDAGANNEALPFGTDGFGISFPGIPGTPAAASGANIIRQDS